MTEIEIFEEVIKIQRKYLTAVESIGAITMSTHDKQRLAFLEVELKKVRTFQEIKNGTEM